MPDLSGFLFLVVLAAVGLAVLAGGMVLALKLLRGGETEDEGAEYKKVDLLTQAEQVFFSALANAAGEGRVVFAKVRLADVIAPKVPRSEGQEWRRAFNSIQSKHLDFVVCDKRSLSVVCAVELDDKSHQRADRVKRDGFLEKALAGAGVPLARFPVAREYKVSDLEAKICAASSGRPSPASGDDKPAFRIT